MCGCVWEKKGLTCYQSDGKCIRAGEYINGGRTLQHKPLFTTEGQRVALMNVGSPLKSGAIRSILDTDGQKCGSYRRGLVPRRKNCPCDLVMGCASADITDGTARTSVIRHSLTPTIPSESSRGVTGIPCSRHYHCCRGHIVRVYAEAMYSHAPL